MEEEDVRKHIFELALKQLRGEQAESAPDAVESPNMLPSNSSSPHPSSKSSPDVVVIRDHDVASPRSEGAQSPPLTPGKRNTLRFSQKIPRNGYESPASEGDAVDHVEAQPALLHPVYSSSTFLINANYLCFTMFLDRAQSRRESIRCFMSVAARALLTMLAARYHRRA